MSLVANEEFQHILRVLNTNVDGKENIMFALNSIKGIGRRFANIVCMKADVDMNKRAGELSAAELENLMVICCQSSPVKIPDWFLNRKKDYKDGRYSQVVSNALDMKLRDDLERLKKIRMSVSQSKRGPGKNKRKWTPHEDAMLVETLLELLNNGTYKADNGFKPGVLRAAEIKLESKLPSCGQTRKIIQGLKIFTQN